MAKRTATAASSKTSDALEAELSNGTCSTWGEINDRQEAAWQKTLELFEVGQSQPRTVALFPEDRVVEVADAEMIRIKLSELQLRHPRQWSACWLACHLYEELQLDGFWAERLKPSVHQMAITSMAKALKFSPDGRLLASLSHGGEVVVWDTGRWDVVRLVPGPKGLAEEDGDLDFSPDGKMLAVGHGDRHLWVIELDTGSARFSIPAHDQMITAVAWSKAGVIATGSGYSAAPIRLWDAWSGKPVGALEGHTSWISRLLFSADGQRLYSASGDQTIRIWNVPGKQCVEIFRGSTDELYGLALSPDGTTLASGSKDGVIATWRAIPELKDERPQRVRMQGKQAAFGPSSRELAVPCDGVIQRYELPGLSVLEPLSAAGTNFVAVAYSPDGKMLAGGTSDGWLHLWSSDEGRHLSEWPTHTGCAGGLAFSRDGGQLISGSYSADSGGELVYWDARTRQRVGSLVTKGAALMSVSSDGHLALSGDDSGQLSWWQTASGSLQCTTRGHRRRVTGAEFSSGGTRAVSVGEDGTLAFWDVPSLKLISHFKGHRLAASAVAFSPDERRVATGSADREVKLWDWFTHRELVLLSQRNSLIHFVAFSPDGNWLAGGDSRGELHLWHAPSKEEIDASARRGK